MKELKKAIRKPSSLSTATSTLTDKPKKEKTAKDELEAKQAADHMTGLLYYIPISAY